MPRRPRDLSTTRHRLAALLAVSAFAIAAAAAAQSATRGSLKITYWAHGSAGTPVSWTLKCGPPRGTHPARHAACTALATHAAELGPATKACPIFSTRTSPRAAVSGIWAGRHVARAYRIGCPGWTDLRVVLTGK
jgi:hypothetical protein